MELARVVVVGAGVAGLAAARTLRGAGVETVLIEAGKRAGGRAWTASIGGQPFDHGASWLHDAGRNPLVAMAVASDGLIDSDKDRVERVSVDGRFATPAELAAYDAAWDSIDSVTAPALLGPDVTLQAAMAPMKADPWAPLVALWEGAIIAAADADRLGVQDWHRNRLGGHNAVPPEGVGAYILRKLRTPVVLETPAQSIGWGGRGVRVTTPRGTITADAAILTVSTGVLSSCAIRFDPDLPPDVADAIGALPMGLLSKVVLRAEGADRLGLAPDTLVVDRSGSMTFNAWPMGRDHIVGYFGGRLAWQASDTPGAGAELARAELRRALGAKAVQAMAAEALETGWATDPLFRGAYAYAGPGDAEARGALAAAFPGERLLFAGEATRTDGLAGTVGGAYLSGVAAAQRLLELSAAPAAGPAGSP